MYSQIFVRTRRYHSSSRPSSLGVVVSPYACFFLHPPFEGGIHFAAQRPRLRSIASIILTLFLDPLPRSSILVSGRATLRAYSPLTHPPSPLSVEIYRPGCRWPRNRGWADSILGRKLLLERY